MTTTTKLVNIEDTMPYVEPPSRPTPASKFRESLEFSLELAQEEKQYYTESKAWARANVQKDLATILTEVLDSDYPETKLESTLDRLRRVYMALTMAQTEAEDARKREIRNRQAPPIGDNQRTMTDAQRAELQKAITNIEDRRAATKDPVKTNEEYRQERIAEAQAVAAKVPSNAEVKYQEAIDKARTQQVLKNLEEAKPSPKALTAGSTKSS
jgi:hypothetical protein